MSEKKITKILKNALSDVGSGDPVRMQKGIEVISSKGHIGIIDELIKLLQKTKDKQLQNRIIILLSDIQDEEAPEIIIGFLNDDSYADVRTGILNAVWNSKLDYSAFLADFVCLAVEGDFMQSLECLTAIENMLGPFEEHHLLESQLYLKEYHSNKTDVNRQKDEIISEIALFIKEQNEGVDADLLLE